MNDLEIQYTMSSSEEQWDMLDCSPDSFNEYIKLLGIRNVHVDWLTDLSTDHLPEGMVAAIVCLPYERCQADFTGSRVQSGVAPLHLQQCIGNVCGATALLHCLINTEGLLLANDAPFATLMEEIVAAPNDVLRGAVMYRLRSIHESVTSHQRDCGAHSESYHFESIVTRDGCVWLLDGRKPAPVAVSRIQLESPPCDIVSFLQERLAKVTVASALCVCLREL